MRKCPNEKGEMNDGEEGEKLTIKKNKKKGWRESEMHG